ncbi:MAG: hypothetical protein R2698_03410 [Microthrixaceae bacterium]
MSAVVERGLGKAKDPTTTAAAADVVPTTDNRTSPSTVGDQVTVTPAPSTTACVPRAAGATVSTVPGSTPVYDPNSEIAPLDPSEVACDGQIDVLVVGDSTGRGFSNGLGRLRDPMLRIWDRTILGCSLGDEKCPDWRVVWREAVATIQPEVAVMYLNPVPDIHGVDDADFLSPKGIAQHEAALDEAATLLSANGAALIMTMPAVPKRPNALLYCDGHGTDSVCDPRWVDSWRRSVRTVAARHGGGARHQGLHRFASGKGSARPDGLHFTVGALTELARWSRGAIDQAYRASHPG